MAQEVKNNALSDDDRKFTVNNRVEIVRILRGLAHERHTLSAIYRGGDDVLLTAVLDIDPKENVVFLDTNASKVNNNRLLTSKRTIFVSNVDGVKVQWISTEISMGEFEGLPAFRIPIPETLQRVQRRGLFRINTPMVNPLICNIPIAEDQEAEVALVDICAEGIGVVLPDPPIPEIDRGAQFENCTIHLPDLGTIKLTLFVQSVWEVTLKNGSISRRAGLEFIEPHSSIQSKVQRYINALQRARIASSVKR